MAINLVRFVPLILVVSAPIVPTTGEQMSATSALTEDMILPQPQSRPGSYFDEGDKYLDLFRVGGKAKRENFKLATEHYIKGLEQGTGDRAYYTNRLGYAYHLERRLKEASERYHQVLAMDPPAVLTSAEFDLVVRLAPRLYVHAAEYFELEDVAVILHPEKPIIEYSLFWDDDIDFPADNDPTDHEKVWIEYDPAAGEFVQLFTYFHRAILSTDEARQEARQNNGRARVNVQWGGHGSLPVGWEKIKPEQIAVKYEYVDKPATIDDMRTRFDRHEKSIKSPDHPLAKGWPTFFDGDWEDYVTFDKYIDLPTLMREKKMAMKSQWPNAVIDQYFLDYQFFPKREWPFLSP
ncbi:MAG: hypothetical protein IH971_03700 [Candidatus Marinimicrobia bacterium]|nr:hypothetical protein [Candidatus Neomarinimicrobiota bacterium]